VAESLDRETEYLKFTETPAPGKTRRWLITSRRGGDRLATIAWHGPWRQFSFQPVPGTIFNTGCLRDIEKFMVDAYDDWRKSKAKEK
jgi:hypothetical protein